MKRFRAWLALRDPGVGWVEFLAGDIALRAVIVAQRRALAREDVHEAAHLTAMVLYGNSSHSETAPCPLPVSFWCDGEALARASREHREEGRT